MSVARGGTGRIHFQSREVDEAFDDQQAERSAMRVSGAYRVRLRADGDIDFENVIEEGREELLALEARGPSVGARLPAAPVSERATFEAVFTGLPLALFVVDPEGQVQYVNSRARALLSLAPKLIEIARSRALRVLRGEVVESEVTSVGLPNGAMSTFRLRTGDVRFVASPAWAVVVVEDVTADSKAEEARRLDEKFREMFVGILGHDLRTPLSSILTAASLAKRRAASADQGRLADIMLRSCRRMARLIEDILDMTQGRLGGGVRVFAEPAEMSQIVASAVEAIEGAAPSGLIEVSSEGSSAGEWDPGRLLQVLTNLLKTLSTTERPSPRSAFTSTALVRIKSRCRSTTKGSPWRPS